MTIIFAVPNQEEQKWWAQHRQPDLKEMEKPHFEDFTKAKLENYSKNSVGKEKKPKFKPITKDDKKSTSEKMKTLCAFFKEPALKELHPAIAHNRKCLVEIVRVRTTKNNTHTHEKCFVIQ